MTTRQIRAKQKRSDAVKCALCGTTIAAQTEHMLTVDLYHGARSESVAHLQCDRIITEGLNSLDEVPGELPGAVAMMKREDLDDYLSGAPEGARAYWEEIRKRGLERVQT